MIFNILPLVAGILSIALGLVVVINGTSEKNSKWPFAIFATSVGIWAIFITLFLMTTSITSAFVYVSIYYVAALLIAYSFLLFSLFYTSTRVSKKVIGLALLPWLGLSTLIVTPGFFIDSVTVYPERSVELVLASYVIYIVTFVTYVAIALVRLFLPLIKKRAKLHHAVLAYALLISLVGGAYFNLFLPLIGNYELIMCGPLFAFVMVAAVFYAIAQHEIFDIRSTVLRTVTYALSLATLAAIYGAVAFVLYDVVLGQEVSPNVTLLNIALTILLAYLYQPTKLFFDKVTHRFFYRDAFNSDEFFARLNAILTSTTGLRPLLERISHEVSSTIRSDQVFFYINTPGDKVLLAGTPKHKQLPQHDAIMLEAVTGNKHSVIVASERSPSDPIRRMMISHRIALIVPLVQADKVLGYMCLGSHMISEYVRRDITILNTISNELIIAIQNALSIQEVKALNETLQQRIDEATKELRASNAQLQRLDKAKDEFVSMASHQLRTPLTSVKGYISMVIEGDAGHISDTQKHLLSEAFTSSERMVHLINDFLNVSRLQTGKFLIDKRPIDLARLVRQELDSLATTAASRNLSFIYKAPTDIPILSLDESKMRQVVMNFVDNALYYSPEHTSIVIKLAIKDKDILFTVKDSGIGVPRGEQSQLFSKFYRASNARKQRPDGTGVGLFLAKKVIVAHGGQVICESVEGKGSTFGFSLPLEALRAAEDTN